MSYDPKNIKKSEAISTMPPDTIFEAVIVEIKDGLVKDFIRPEVEWKGSRDERAINCYLESKVNDKQVKITQLFTYFDEAGSTTYNEKSNLGKFIKKYTSAPEVGMKVKVITNEKGYGRVLL